jgi:hypothetical protein
MHGRERNGKADGPSRSPRRSSVSHSSANGRKLPITVGSRLACSTSVMTRNNTCPGNARRAGDFAHRDQVLSIAPCRGLGRADCSVRTAAASVLQRQAKRPGVCERTRRRARGRRPGRTMANLNQNIESLFTVGKAFAFIPADPAGAGPVQPVENADDSPSPTPRSWPKVETPCRRHRHASSPPRSPRKNLSS